MHDADNSPTGSVKPPCFGEFGQSRIVNRVSLSATWIQLIPFALKSDGDEETLRRLEIMHRSITGKSRE